MKSIVRGAAIAALLLATACSQAEMDRFQAGLTRVNVFASKYGPIIGRDLIMVANIIVQAECSPALAPVSQASINVLNIVAPNRNAALKIQDGLTKNQAIAQQLCPLAQAINTSVGAVPAGTPSQVVTLPTS